MRSEGFSSNLLLSEKIFLSEVILILFAPASRSLDAPSRYDLNFPSALREGPWRHSELNPRMDIFWGCLVRLTGISSTFLIGSVLRTSLWGAYWLRNTSRFRAVSMTQGRCFVVHRSVRALA